MIVQLAAGLNPPEVTQLSVSAKPAGATMLGIVTGTFPVFKIVTVCAALVVFTGWFPNVREGGITLMVDVAPPTRPTDCVPPFCPLFVIVIESVSGRGVPAAGAVHVTMIVHVPFTGMLAVQPFVSLKSPF